MKRLKGLDSCFRRNNDDLPSFSRNAKLSPYEDFTVYLMRGKKFIVYGNFVKIKAFLRKYFEAKRGIGFTERLYMNAPP
jgi:hypothetical protein